jgi:hypothetical protein
VGAQAIFTSSLVRTIGPAIGATIDQIDNLSVSEVGGLKELADPWGTPIRSCLSTSPSPAPTNTARWRQPRSSAWKSSTKVGAPRSMTRSVRCSGHLLPGRVGQCWLCRPGPSSSAPFTPPPRTHSRLGARKRAISPKNIEEDTIAVLGWQPFAPAADIYTLATESRCATRYQKRATGALQTTDNQGWIPSELPFLFHQVYRLRWRYTPTPKPRERPIEHGARIIDDNRRLHS